MLMSEVLKFSFFKLAKALPSHPLPVATLSILGYFPPSFPPYPPSSPLNLMLPLKRPRKPEALGLCNNTRKGKGQNCVSGGEKGVGCAHSARLISHTQLEEGGRGKPSSLRLGLEGGGGR